jgi:hypothetical protein
MSRSITIAAAVLALAAACTRVIVEPSPCDPARPGAEAAPTASAAAVDAGGACAADGGGDSACPDADAGDR